VVGSAAARQERSASRSRHRGVSARDARALLLDEFGQLLAGLTSSVADVGPEGRFREFFDDYTARVQTSAGDRVVAVGCRCALPGMTASSDRST